MKQWRLCKEATNYEISDHGEVRNKNNGRILKPGTNAYGYQTVVLCNNHKRLTRRVHRLVAETFDDSNIDRTDLDVIHRDGDKTNNKLSNLIWGTRSETVRGTFLTNKDQTHRVRKICCVETGEVFDTQSDCSKKMGINIASININLKGRSKSTKNGYRFKYVE